MPFFNGDLKPDVWDEVEDMTEALRKIQEEGPHSEESHDEEESRSKLQSRGRRR
jgi:hypothetical protein